MKLTAGWCRRCDKPVWLPHESHPESVIVEYDAGKRPRLPGGRPRPPELLEIKRYRGETELVLETTGIRRHMDDEEPVNQGSLQDLQYIATLRLANHLRRVVQDASQKHNIVCQDIAQWLDCRKDFGWVGVDNMEDPDA